MVIHRIADNVSSSVFISNICKSDITPFVSPDVLITIAESSYVNLNLYCDEFIIFEVFSSFLINVIEHSFLTHFTT
jgi:hypothetical protein